MGTTDDKAGTPATPLGGEGTTPATKTDTDVKSPEELQAEIEALKSEVARKDKMVKDTQAGFTKKSQELAKLKADREYKKQLTPERQEELNNLKETNVDEWYKQMKIEEDKKAEIANTAVDTVTTATSREQQLASFNANNGASLTQDQLDYDVPLRLKKQLEAGEVGYEEYLKKANEFVTSGKVVGTPETLDQPNLNNTKGADTPQVTDEDLAGVYGSKDAPTML